jgi:hypothetical protein
MPQTPLELRSQPRTSQTRRVSRVFAVLGLLGMGTGFGVTNPSQAAYSEFAASQATHYLVQELCSQPANLPSALNQALGQGCATLSKAGKSEIRKFVNYNTQHQNFVLFSLYTTDLPLRRLVTLGILGNFYVLDASS